MLRLEPEVSLKSVERVLLEMRTALQMVCTFIHASRGWMKGPSAKLSRALEQGGKPI